MKVCNGRALTQKEKDYLKEHDPETYEKARSLERQKNAYESALKRCRTKEGPAAEAGPSGGIAARGQHGEAQSQHQQGQKAGDSDDGKREGGQHRKGHPGICAAGGVRASPGRAGIPDGRGARTESAAGAAFTARSGTGPPRSARSRPKERSARRRPQTHGGGRQSRRRRRGRPAGRPEPAEDWRPRPDNAGQPGCGRGSAARLPLSISSPAQRSSSRKSPMRSMAWAARLRGNI